MARWLYGSVVACSLVLLVVATGNSSTPFLIEIVDDQSGKPVAATVFLSDENDKPILPDGNLAQVQYLGKTRHYADGSVRIAAAPRKLTVEVRRGFETLPVTQIILIDTHTRKATIRLRRWIDMSARGYQSGDTHVHYLSLADSHLQMRAEDMGVLNLLTSDFTNDADKFTGRVDPISTPDAFIHVGQEFRDWQHGHVILLGITKLFEPLGPAGGGFRNKSNPHRLQAPALRFARAQAGTVTSWAHFTNLPGIESAVDISLGLLDAVDLITNNDPMGLPSHWAPWQESGMQQAEFPVMRGVDLYYQYLNVGVPLHLGAGSDKMGTSVPVGNNRFYARLDGPASYEAWLAALKAGRGFISNHPMLFFTVDGHKSGDVINFKGKKSVTATVKVSSMLPVVNLEILVNGREVLTKSTFPWEDKPVDGVHHYEATAQIDLTESSWIAARAAQHPDFPAAVLPRNLSVFAHANPIHFLRDGKPVRVAASQRYLGKYLDVANRWFQKGANFQDPAERKMALDMVRQARKAVDRR